MDRIPEQLTGRIGGIVRCEVGIARRVAVSAPHALEYSSPGIEHNDAPIQVSVADVDLMSLFVHLDSSRTLEHGRISIVHRRGRRMANLQYEFPVVGELDRLPVFGPIPGDPDVADLVHENTVLGSRPVIAVTWAAPRFDQVALAIEFQHWRRRGATHGYLFVQAKVILDVRRRALQDPDMIVLVHRYPANLPHDPVVGQRFWPSGVDLVCGWVLCSHW